MKRRLWIIVITIPLLLISRLIGTQYPLEFQVNHDVADSNVQPCTVVNANNLANWRPTIRTGTNSTHDVAQCLHELETMSSVTFGGKWRPHKCTPSTSVAIVIPYRDRLEHLQALLCNLHQILQLQQTRYGIYVIEQNENSQLNRGMLLNVGFDIARKDGAYDCYIFHDVDLIPENAANLYVCGNNPRHLCPAVDKFNYKLPYNTLFGGVTAFTETQFRRVNGFSNQYYSWGGEDDDIYARCTNMGYNIERPSSNIGRYTMMKHDGQTRNPYRFLLGKHSFQNNLWQNDGISSLKYDILRNKKYPLYTSTLVDLHDYKAKFFIEEALKELRRSLPVKLRNVTDFELEMALEKLKSAYRGPYQVAKILHDLHRNKTNTRY